MPTTAVALLLTAALAQGDPATSTHSWTQLSLGTCRVDEFLAKHPESDGRGVVIAILDTGVDPSIPGLTATPEGQVKVIDVQDFTGEGDVELHRVRLDAERGKLVETAGSDAPIEYQPPEVIPAPEGEERLWWFGTLNEKKFVNSDQPDLNGNGKTDDKFPVVVTALSGDGDDQAVCYVDTNLDRSFADEAPLQNYRLYYDTFTLARPKPESEIIPLTFAANIFLRQSKVVFHFDDGGHGTHVAGIAAGFCINDQTGFNGVAPGAKLMSLKIGNNAIGGVSTTESMKKAFNYAARFGREHDVPVVCNLSYAVESEIEGHSDIDKFVDDLLQKNPNLIFCAAASNSGPGLSTIGTPAAASAAITVGALLAVDTGRDASGYTMPQPSITLFSSRGGELAKPDIVTPGWSTSTVPRWIRSGDFWSGTSMASPYATGLCAVLVSHMLHTQPGNAVRACDVRRALCLTAKPAVGATPLDMGYGIPDLPAAAELLGRLVQAARNDPVLGYAISTPCPQGFAGRSSAAYWRSTWFPGEDRQTFTISPIFAPLLDAEARTTFTRKFELRSQTPWCRVPQDTIYLHSEQSARAFVEYDASKLSEPGLYVGTVDALADGLPAFRLVSTIIVPYRFEASENFARDFTGTAEGWKPERYFLMVPPGASAMRLRLTAPEGTNSKAGFPLIFAPRGEQTRNDSKRLDTEAGRREVEWTVADKLTPGVWEVDVTSNRPDKSWAYRLGVRFFGLHAEPRQISKWDGDAVSGDVVITNLFEQPLPASAEGKIEGFRLHKDDVFKGLKDELSHTVTLDERFDRVRLHIELEPDDYAKATDIGVMVLDESGTAVFKDAFNWRTLDATFATGDAKTLKVVVNAGFAVADDKRETPISINIDQLLATPIEMTVTRDDQSAIDFVPGVPIKVKFAATQKPKDAPEGTHPVGYLSFRERSSNEEALRVRIATAE